MGIEALLKFLKLFTSLNNVCIFHCFFEGHWFLLALLLLGMPLAKDHPWIDVPVYQQYLPCNSCMSDIILDLASHGKQDFHYSCHCDVYRMVTMSEVLICYIKPYKISFYYFLENLVSFLNFLDTLVIWPTYKYSTEINFNKRTENKRKTTWFI
jgi:hypothetical protein